MNRDQKQVLKTIGVMVAVKAAIYGTIYYSAKWSRQQQAKLEKEY